MGKLAATYQIIADILSYKNSKDDLEKHLSVSGFDWDSIVVEGSKHLVLPAIYCRLKAKGLLHLLPIELNTYLEEITTLNRNRNTALLEQVQTLYELLNTNDVTFVFLKGSALIASDYYDDIAERMIGDIDILIAEDQLEFAFDLLNKNGYTPIEQTLGADFFEHKHLPRLKTEKYISAVELHKKLFVSYKDAELTNSKVLMYKQQENDIPIPSNTHLLRHNILNYQINDNGSLYNSISFRAAYDTITLLKAQNFDISDQNNKHIRRHLQLIGLFFKEIEVKTSITASFYLFKLKHIAFYKFWNKLLKFGNFILILANRTLFFLTNSAYRKAIFNDRKRIYKLVKSLLHHS